MSGRQDKKAAPIFLTQQDVDGLAKGGKVATSVRRRLRYVTSGKSTISKSLTGKACPQPVSRQEMAAIVKGRVPSAVRERIVLSSPSRTEATSYSATEKVAPTATPPSALKHRRGRTATS